MRIEPLVGPKFKVTACIVLNGGEEDRWVYISDLNLRDLQSFEIQEYEKFSFLGRLLENRPLA